MEVREGEDFNIVCIPSSASVGLEWELPDSVVSNEATIAVVQYTEPLRHTLTIHKASTEHTGLYTCRVAGNKAGDIPTTTTSIIVRESKSTMCLHITIILSVVTVCPEDFSGGLFWEVAYDGDTLAKPCRDVDQIFR